MAEKNTGLLISVVPLYSRVESIFSESFLDIPTCVIKASGHAFLGFTEAISTIQALYPFSAENTLIEVSRILFIFFQFFNEKLKLIDLRSSPGQFNHNFLFFFHVKLVSCHSSFSKGFFSCSEQFWSPVATVFDHFLSLQLILLSFPFSPISVQFLQSCQNKSGIKLNQKSHVI